MKTRSPLIVKLYWSHVTALVRWSLVAITEQIAASKTARKYAKCMLAQRRQTDWRFMIGVGDGFLTYPYLDTATVKGDFSMLCRYASLESLTLITHE